MKMSLSCLVFAAAFHVTEVSRWTAPLAANAKSGTSDCFSPVFLKCVDVPRRRQHFLPRSCVHLRPYSVFRQPPGGIPGSQPLLPNSLDPTRPQGETGAVGIDSIWSDVGGVLVILASDYGD